MKVAHALNGGDADHGRIAGENDDMVIPRQRSAGHHQRVAGSTLLGLYNEINAGMLHRCAYALCLMADDRKHIVGWHNPRGRPDYVLQDRPAANFM